MEEQERAAQSAVYRLHPAVAIENFDDRALALHCQDLRLVELNATARDLLRHLDGRSSLPQVAAALAEEYGQPPAAVLADVKMIVARLLDLGLLERLPSRELAAGKEATASSGTLSFEP